ncbi:uncharacterized protein LAJ45_11675 [Morchella importuna]|uniref:uncharacterized protein n=1 Tax=Morchella importuna TaxID=1174673 RepID=UPI001E8DC196|nr:uncharacterized protein LAJ45_11675 [Morchella importuna]KAH8144353.1 hypothetical protein LAJ45_11675 [Morchella importuna]
MAPTKCSSGSAPLAPKHPRLPKRPEEHEDLLTDESEIFYRTLTPLPACTPSSQSTTAAQITRKGLLRSSETPTGRSSLRRVEFHLPEDHTDNFEVQEEPEAIEAPEVEETVDTSHSDYDDALENDHESSEEDEDEPEDEPQAPPPQSYTQKSQTVGKRPHTVQPITARAVGNARRKPTGAVAEVIASSNVSVDVRGTRPGAKVIRKQGQGRAAPTSAPSQNVSQGVLPASQRALPASQRAPPTPSQSMPSAPVYAHEYTSSTRHIDFSWMRSRYGESYPTYRTYRSSPPSEVIGENSMSSRQIPSSQLHGQGRSRRVYEIEYLSSSREEDESTPMPESEGILIPESEGILIPGSAGSILEDTHDIFENTGDIPSSQLTQRSVVPNSRSANVLSVQAQRIEKECSVLIGEHTLLHEPFPPAARLSVLVVSMWATASRRVGCRVDLDEVVIKQVSAPKGLRVLWKHN